MTRRAWYFSVVIPFTITHANEWTPMEALGPLATLTRGAFRTEDEAREQLRARVQLRARGMVDAMLHMSLPAGGATFATYGEASIEDALATLAMRLGGA